MRLPPGRGKGRPVPESWSCVLRRVRGGGADAQPDLDEAHIQRASPMQIETSHSDYQIGTKVVIERYGCDPGFLIPILQDLERDCRVCAAEGDGVGGSARPAQPVLRGGPGGPPPF